MYVLHSETSIGYTDIFGQEVTYTETVEESRGSILDKVLGKKSREVTRLGRTPGMRAQTLQTYIDLMQEHSERKQREQKKGKMRQKKKSKMGGF